jgi:hypothetical protein
VPAVDGLADGEPESGDVYDGKELGRRGEPGPRKDDPEGEDEGRKAWWLLLSSNRCEISPGRVTNAPSWPPGPLLPPYVTPAR